jgi:lipopolysaccharide/colanic/teichoic acid biosynthesis glycosyltransferase
MKRSHRVYDPIKRLLDVAVAATLLVLLSPVLLAVAVAVRVNLGSPVLFSQPRPGRSGRIFTLRKFRSMRDAPAGATLEQRVATDGERTTRLGRALRTSSLDELPQLLNVLVGDMSVVGPRPLLPEYLDRYNERQARRHEVRPGITGWAQVNGRNATTWEERFEMDVTYVDHRSFALDARIIWMTFAALFNRRGVTTTDGTSMPPFDPDRDRPGARL